jgi:hypothetical protein
MSEAKLAAVTIFLYENFSRFKQEWAKKAAVTNFAGKLPLICEYLLALRDCTRLVILSERRSESSFAE